MNMIEIKSLRKQYGKDLVLNDISLCIEQGDIYGLMGRSGAGKSTLLRCINGLETYDAGTLTVNGIEVSSLSRKEERLFRRDIGMVFQDFSLLKRLDVFNNVALPMKCWNYSRKKIERRVEELLELVGLSDKVKYFPSQLSGGQQQRVAIARALALGPKLLLCDEATSALDPITTGVFLDLLREINEKMGLTIVIVAHQPAVIQKCCKRMAILEGGSLVKEGKTAQLFLEELSLLTRAGEGEECERKCDDRNVELNLTLSGEQMDEPIFSRMGREVGTDFVIINAHRYQTSGDEIVLCCRIAVPERYEKLVLHWFGERGIECVSIFDRAQTMSYVG